MANCLDVAAYILEQKKELTTIKLQKLVYYSQAWSLVWDEAPLFAEPIQAWANGPVVPSLFAKHRGQFKINLIEDGNSSNLSADEKETIDSVLKTYGDKSAQWLVALTHLEKPWLDARAGCPDGSSCNTEITQSAMAEYYSGL
ncbi:type II toxin-antitoxin system antitoxin SocA domain-containing protein [Maridesulfovibrio sp.]|uniref:Panacea domain-containing protein n=1 Tax=Maridesulfovibrio sp. TaxID=2795000 RepID=UPI0029CA685A|nr:type II toxin-antitoxin system antitoxin SocA domain-containing protein [Maridesulfovibrio sp.]